MNTVKNAFRIIYTAWGILLFVFCVIICYLYAVVKFKQKNIKAYYNLFKLFQWCSNNWLMLTGMKLKVEGSEYFNLRKDYILVGNHSSTLDIFAMASSVPIPFKALAKIELESIPIMGFLFKTGCVHVDRVNRESRYKSIQALKDELALGYSILIMPEGTRNKSNKPLGDFKEGAFRIAVETQTPILPFVILNVRTLMPYPLNIIQKPGTIHVKFLPPIYVNELIEDDIVKLKNKTYTILEQELLRYDSFFQ